MCCVLAFMFVALISDRVGADMVMMTSLTLCMASGIITIEEGLVGFSNEGLLTVLVLFVVAAGIGHTGALDWYMGRLLGRPKNTTDGQLRLMLPVAIVSAFLNNTPVVAVMIPIVQRWGQNVGISHQQLLVPLSFASILGGTCTLIGTSTNLVVVGLLNDRYPDNSDINIGLFDLGKYGVPIALIGLSYILVSSPFLLPGGGNSSAGGASESIDSILLGARLTRWSTAAGRSVKRSGLRDTGGIFLVSVLRCTTGNMHRAVGQDFVLNVGDVLYFTGLVEEFGDFCHEHGLEMITTEVDVAVYGGDSGAPAATSNGGALTTNGHSNTTSLSTKEESDAAALPTILQQSEELAPIGEVDDEEHENSSVADNSWSLGETGQSLVQSEDEVRLRSINKITDMIRGTYEPGGLDVYKSGKGRRRRKTVSSLFGEHDPTKIIIVKDTNIRFGDKPMVMIAVNCRDRPGLLLDISRGLLRLSLQLHHSEAAVIGFRSLSVWRCEALEDAVADIQEMWSVLNALLENESGVHAVKERGLRVIRAVVQKGSRLVGKTAMEVNFRETYKAAIMTCQRGGKSGESLTAFKFQAGDMLVLQASDDSPLLLSPPEDFYKNLDVATRTKRKRSTSGSSLSELLKSISNPDISGLGKSKNRTEKESSSVGSEEVSRKMDDTNSQGSQRSLVGSEDGGFGFFGDTENDSHARNGASADEEVGGDEGISRMQTEEAWADLKVIQAGGSAQSSSREFLSAMELTPRSALADKTAAQSGLDKLSGVFLVEIERPVPVRSIVTQTVLPASQTVVPRMSATPEPIHSRSISPFDQPLQSGDVLWYAGSATAIGDLRKIPGLKPVEDDQVKKVEGDIHERRLVQAVVARQGPLVGKTVKDMRFRTRYGAAVIAVHREGKRVHDHPGQVKLHAGDVLLLEAGPSFFVKSANNDKSFALLSEVKDSAPPRLSLLIPALTLTAAALAVYTANVASLLVCALVASILMVCFGILSQQEVRNAINWDVYVTIAAAFGIGTALTNSGVAGGVADFLVSVGDAIALGDAGLLGAVYFATFLISNVVTNNAAAALIFPIAIDSAEQTGIDVTLMSFSVMLGASASFMSPFGYTTNLLVYGPGSYTYSDFLRMGTPMQIVLWILSVALLSLDPSQWYIGWIGTTVVFLLVVAVRMSSGVLTNMCRTGSKSD